MNANARVVGLAKELGDLVEFGPEGLAVFSPCSLYRYYLTRTWDRVSPQKIAAFVMLNPSTADAFVLDPTIRRCVNFAKREACTGLIVVNIYAYRSVKPNVLNEVVNPVGVHNLEWISLALERADLAIGAWGATRAKGVEATADVGRLACTWRKTIYALRMTQDGHPGHPLYIPSGAALIPLDNYAGFR